MRVITGTARGRKLLSPEGDGVRPTAAKVKESIFSIIQFEVEGRRVLDLFAGSGQLAIEALSRGALSAVFVEQSAVVAELIRKNLAGTQLNAKARLEKSDAFAFLNITRDVFDIAFLDPPYNKGYINKALPLLVPHMAKGAVIVCESLDTEELPESVEEFELYRTYKYSNTMLSIYRN